MDSGSQFWDFKMLSYVAYKLKHGSKLSDMDPALAQMALMTFDESTWREIAKNPGSMDTSFFSSFQRKILTPEEADYMDNLRSGEAYETAGRNADKKLLAEAQERKKDYSFSDLSDAMYVLSEGKTAYYRVFPDVRYELESVKPGLGEEFDRLLVSRKPGDMEAALSLLKKALEQNDSIGYNMGKGAFAGLLAELEKFVENRKSLGKNHLGTVTLRRSDDLSVLVVRKYGHTRVGLLFTIPKAEQDEAKGDAGWDLGKLFQNSTRLFVNYCGTDYVFQAGSSSARGSPAMPKDEKDLISRLGIAEKEKRKATLN